MLADNLTLFGSQINDLKELRGMDDNLDGSMMMDQSIVVDNQAQLGGGQQPFDDNLSMVAGDYQRGQSFQGQRQRMSSVEPQRSHTMAGLPPIQQQQQQQMR